MGVVAMVVVDERWQMGGGTYSIRVHPPQRMALACRPTWVLILAEVSLAIPAKASHHSPPCYMTGKHHLAWQWRIHTTVLNFGRIQ